MTIDIGQKAVYSAIDVLARRMDEGTRISAHVSDIAVEHRARKLVIIFYEGEIINKEEMSFIRARALLKDAVNNCVFRRTSHKLEGAWTGDDYECVLTYEADSSADARS